MKLCDILKDIEYSLINIDESEEILALSLTPENSDERTALILPGQKQSANIKNKSFKACCVICSEDTELPDGIPAVKVKNPRAAMAFAYSNFYSTNYSKMKIIGVTGTNGKTSTATFLEKALSGLGKIGFIGTGSIRIGGVAIQEEFYSMTTPDPPLLYKVLKRMENEDCFAVVMEVSSHALALSKVAPIRFDYGILTNLSPEHMDFHSDMEEYYLTKKKLFSSSKCGVFNIDEGYARRAFKECNTRKISVGALFRGDVYASGIIDRGFDGVSYLYHGQNFSFRMNLRTPGIYNVYNSLLAIAVATDMGAVPCKVKESLAAFVGIEGRYEIIKDEITVIIDYAHTVAAFESVLKSIKAASINRPLTVVFGAGGERDKTKRPKMAAAAEKYADKIIVTEDNSRGEEPMEIISDVIKGFREKSYRISIDRRRAIKEAILSASAGEVVAIIGKGAEKYNIDKRGYHRFDEKEIIELSLRERKKYANKA